MVKRRVFLKGFLKKVENNPITSPIFWPVLIHTFGGPFENTPHVSPVCFYVGLGPFCLALCEHFPCSSCHFFTYPWSKLRQTETILNENMLANVEWLEKGNNFTDFVCIGSTYKKLLSSNSTSPVFQTVKFMLQVSIPIPCMKGHISDSWPLCRCAGPWLQ